MEVVVIYISDSVVRIQYYLTNKIAQLIYLTPTLVTLRSLHQNLYR